MTKKYLFLTLPICIVWLFVFTVNGQSRSVKFRFEVDGRPIKSQPKIVFYAGDEKLAAVISGDSFIFPFQLQKQEKVDVRFISGKYDLLFESVYISKFEGEWVIGVDK